MNRPAAESHVKILFEIEGENGSIETESLWAIPVEAGYKIDNIPFYARDVALDDVVQAEPDDDGMLRYTGLVEASGHSTVRLWFSDTKQVASVREVLRQMGCVSEVDLARLVAVDVPERIPYAKVRAYLDIQENAGILDYEESCMAEEEAAIRPDKRSDNV